MEQQFPSKLRTILPGDPAFPRQLLEKRIPNTFGVYAASNFGHYMIQKYLCANMAISIHHLSLSYLLHWSALPARQSFYLTIILRSTSSPYSGELFPRMLVEGTYKVLYCPGKPLPAGMSPGEYEFFQVRIPLKEMVRKKKRYPVITWLLQYVGEGLEKGMQQIAFPVSPEMSALYNKVIAELKKAAPSQTIIENAMWGMMVIYASSLSYKINQSMAKERPLNQQIIDFIRSRPGQPVSVPVLATHFLQSLTSFKKLCRQQLGMPPGEFIRLQSLEWAAELLIQYPEATIEEIVWQVGFLDPDNFRNHFKAQFKQTPTAWRQKYPKGIAAEKPN